MSEEEDVCSLPSMVGGPEVWCRAMHQRWYYNSEAKKCESFNWGGCGGNANRFNTEEECKERCVK